jgi:RNA polymerase sigma-70 factor (ECF subfamily)
MTEDRLLIERCKQGDSQALQRIYDEYREHLVVLAMALAGNLNEAEDNLHDVYHNFVRNLDRFKLTGKLKAYLAVCVVNQARNNLKRANYRQGTDLDQVVIVATDQRGPVNTAICNEQVFLISEALIQLPMEQRSVIALHLHSGLTFRAIGKQLNVSVGTIKSRYRYGITKLRSILQKEAAS